MSPAALFVTGLGTGLLAGGASCAAVQGGLLAGAVTRRAPLVAARRGAHAVPTHARPREPTIRPIGVFLIGKLAAHTVAGAGLGIFGAAMQPGPTMRAVLLLAAAAIMLIFALELIGLPLARRLAPRTPVSGFRLLRRGSRSGWAFAPALLGIGTILVPCGVTLSIALLAVTSGSALGGAAVMAGFVLGTAPLFTALGYLLRTTARAWQGRLRMITGLVVLAIAGWTAFSGLQLGGWLTTTAPRPAPAAATPGTPQTAPRQAMAPQQVITLTARGDGYVPAALIGHTGRPTTLVLRTRRTTGCTRTFVIPALGMEKVLPKTGRTTIDLGIAQPGTLTFTCGMGMYGGAIQFR